MRGRMKFWVGLSLALVMLLALALMGFASQDTGGSAAIKQTSDTLRSSLTGVESSASTWQGQHVQAFVYWPLWRSGS